MSVDQSGSVDVWYSHENGVCFLVRDSSRCSAMELTWMNGLLFTGPMPWIKAPREGRAVVGVLERRPDGWFQVQPTPDEDEVVTFLREVG